MVKAQLLTNWGQIIHLFARQTGESSRMKAPTLHGLVAWKSNTNNKPNNVQPAKKSRFLFLFSFLSLFFLILLSQFWSNTSSQNKPKLNSQLFNKYAKFTGCERTHILITHKCYNKIMGLMLLFKLRDELSWKLQWHIKHHFRAKLMPTKRLFKSAYLSVYLFICFCTFSHSHVRIKDSS